MTMNVTLDPRASVENDNSYEQYRENFNTVFNKHVAAGAIFTTNLSELNQVWEGWFSRLPAEHQQHYNCRSCRKFFDQHMGLVVVVEAGNLQSAFLPADEETPDIFKASADWLRAVISRSTIQGVYAPDEDTVLGVPVSPTGWKHFSGVFTVDQSPIELKGEEHEFVGAAGIFVKDILEVPKDNWGPLKLLVEAGRLNQHKQLQQTQWTIEMFDWITANKGTPGFINKLWVKLAPMPYQWIKFKSRVISTLIFWEDNIEQAFNLFLKATDPIMYQRAQKDASEKQITEATKLIKSLGMEKSLLRRPAKFDDLRYVWRTPEKIAVNTETDTSDPFGNLLKGNTGKKSEEILQEPIKISFAAFMTHQLPKAKGIRIKFIDRTYETQLFSYMTAVDPLAPPIYQHDLPEDRYPVNEWTTHERHPKEVWLGTHWRNVDFYDVEGIVRASSNVRKPYDFLSEQIQEGYFIIRGAGVTDDSPTCIFPTLLIPELHGIRAVIENYSNKTPVKHSPTLDVEAVGVSVYHPLLVELALENGKAYYLLTK